MRFRFHRITAIALVALTESMRKDVRSTGLAILYAVVVANTTAQEATVTVTRGINVVAQVKVAPNNAKVVQLPYVDALVTPTINEAGPSRVVVDGSYRLRSNQPVTVYQYEPYDYTAQNLFSFTNDASLLLPVNTWSGNYIVASYYHWPFQGFNVPGFYAVVARQDNTKVTLLPSATGKSIVPGGGVAANGTGVVMLNEGDVLEVFTQSLKLEVMRMLRVACMPNYLADIALCRQSYLQRKALWSQSA